MLNETTINICKQADEDMHMILNHWEKGNPMSMEDGIAYLVNCHICDRMGMKDYWRHYQEDVYGAKFPENDNMEHYHDKMPCNAKKGNTEALTMKEIDHWLSKMKNQDGTVGGHWTIEQTTAVGDKHGIDWNVIPKHIFYLGLNKNYSDHYNTAVEYNAQNTPDFFVSLFMDDVDDYDSVSIEKRMAVAYNHIAKL